MNNKDIINAKDLVASILSAGGDISQTDINEALAKIPEPSIQPQNISTRTISKLMQFKSSSDIIENIKRLVEKLSFVDDNIFIQGDTGVGKELIAEALHGGRKGAFVAINVTALPSELLESELFGHLKGSFTGAYNDKRGLIAEAEGGTLFLDEISDMPALLQAKLLRVIQERKYRPVGAIKTKEFNVRFISASHRCPREYLRRDLYWRLCEHIVKIPSLVSKERTYDLDLIALYYAGKYNLGVKDEEILKYIFEPDNLMMIQEGNVRAVQCLLKRYKMKEKPSNNIK